MRIGFIGLGRMGAGMAANLIRAGHELTVFNRSAAKSRPLVELGAHEGLSIADACRGDAVITMLANDTALADTVWTSDGLLENLVRGAMHVSMSTISVALSKRLAPAHAQAGQHYVAAPVFGRPEMAAAGKLFIVSAGEPDVLEKCLPLFQAMGQRTFPMGSDPAAANLVKLSGNFMIAAAIEALGEALALLGKAGIDRRAYVDLLSATIFPGTAYKTYGGLIVDGKFESAGFTAALGHKDIRLTLAAAEALSVPMPMASLLRDRFLRLSAHGGDELDWSAIGALAAQDAGPA